MFDTAHQVLMNILINDYQKFLLISDFMVNDILGVIQLLYIKL